MAVRDTQAMIAGMNPQLVPGVVVFVTFDDADLVAGALPRARALIREAEGTTLIQPADDPMAPAMGAPMRQITLQVQSDLEGVGLTAAVAEVLAAAGIAANVVVAYHHDHVFVPVARADEAVHLLRQRAKTATASGLE